MCEIATLDPARFSTGELTQIAFDIYTSNRTALGIVAVYEEEESFRYEEYKSLQPEREDVAGFFEVFDDARWFIIHGRLATSGEKASLEAAHPIHVECDECEVESVLHNGVFADYNMRKGLQNQGHDYQTEVDTETIAHQFGVVPETIEEAEEVLERAPKIAQQFGFILLGEKRFYLYAGRRYEINEKGEMYVYYRDFSNNDTDKQYQQMIAKAGGSND